MLDEDSPIREFYPSNFAVDIEGKHADWEAVVLLPFMDAARLLEAYEAAAAGLSAAEVARNQCGRICIYEADPTSTEVDDCETTLPAFSPSVTASASRCTKRDPIPALPPGQQGFLPVAREVRTRSGLLDMRSTLCTSRHAIPPDDADAQVGCAEQSVIPLPGGEQPCSEQKRSAARGPSAGRPTAVSGTGLHIGGRTHRAASMEERRRTSAGLRCESSTLRPS